MLDERGISLGWVEQAIGTPDRVEDKPDGTRHFMKRIAEYDGRWLRVIVNVRVTPERAVTAFFDRRLGRMPYED